jgi:hypothetical protein
MLCAAAGLTSLDGPFSPRSAFAVTGLERQGGMVLYDITNPVNPRFVQYEVNRNFSTTLRASNLTLWGNQSDLAPEQVIEL